MMNFENWVTDTFASTSLNEAVSRHASHPGMNKVRKALHMADSMLEQETVTDIAVGKFAGFGDSLLVVTSERALILKNSFQAGHVVSFGAETFGNVRFSQAPLVGHTLAFQGGAYRFSRISGEFIAGLREIFAAERALPQLAQAA